MLNIGDTVRFLNDVGGGKIVKIDATTKMVYVEDENGFEIPVFPQECVVVNNVKTNNFPMPEPKSVTKAASVPVQDKFVPTPVSVAEPVYETSEGDELNVLLAFIPMNVKQLQTSAYDCVLINDSNYFLFYNIVGIVNGQCRSLANGLMEPNMQDTFHRLEKEELNDWENLRLQLIPFKRGKNYQPQHVLDVDVKLNLVNFYKLHAFTANDYFDEPAMLINLQEKDHTRQLEAVSAEQIRESILRKEIPAEHRPVPIKKLPHEEVLEIDLHIAQLLDSTAGMSNADMLNYQMEIFHKTMMENLKHRGKRIVFIHGKGEGVLRKEIEKALKTKYKQCRFQDASFREYGFGATLVII